MEGELEPEAAAARYESELRNSFRLEGAESPRFDLVAAGDGAGWAHGFSFSPHRGAPRDGPAGGGQPRAENKDTWRITLTWPVINRGSAVFFLIGGADKAQILNEVLTGPRDPERLPSQLIMARQAVYLHLILDRPRLRFCPRPDGKAAGFSRGKDDSGGRCRRHQGTPGAVRLYRWQTEHTRDKRYPAKEYAGLEEIVKEFLVREKVTAACFGVPGPVRDGRLRLTNLPWTLDSRELARGSEDRLRISDQ